MDYYSDISILPDPEFPATVLMNAIYDKLHKGLCDLHSTSIGISFPQYDLTLGNILRIHGKKTILQELFDLNWLGGMNGYCTVSTIASVPVCTKFRTVSRKQSTMSQSKLRRLIRRGSLTETGINHYETKMFSKRLISPYVELMSGSTGHKHRRYIELGRLIEQPILGEFDQFGLSKIATVPWFD